MSSISAAPRIAGLTAARPRRIGRRVAAVVAGLLANAIAASATDAVLR